MFLRATTRKKDGKKHRYFSIEESRRVSGGRVLQRHVLYLGEINSSPERAWRRSSTNLTSSTPEEFSELIRRDLERWGPIMKELNIQFD